MNHKVTGNKMNKIHIERIKYITAVVLYGTIGMFLRYVDMPSEIIAMFRGILGSIFIYLYLKLSKKNIDIQAIKNNLKWLVASGIFLGFNWILLFSAYTHTTVAIASLCNYMAPIIVIIIAPVVLKEPLEKNKLIYVLIAFIGIVLVSDVFNSEIGSMFGVIMGLLAALCFVGIVICNRKIKDINVYDKAIVQLAMSAITILPYALIRNVSTDINVNIQTILIIAMLGIVHTGFAYCLYFSGLSSLSVQSIAVLGYLEPVVSILCSVFILHESMSISGWIGAIMILFAACASELQK